MLFYFTLKRPKERPLGQTDGNAGTPGSWNLIMPPAQARVVCYHQTHYRRNREYVSILPFITEAIDLVSITHLIVAAFHINEGPGNITLNDDPPHAPQNDVLWEEVRILQEVGIKVMGMLGGAAKGSFERLDSSASAFESFYLPFRDTIRMYSLDGLDLDVEEEVSLAGIIRLIDRLKSDFPDSFLITLSPVATALQGQPHLSGFDYEALEVMRGSSIAWYNVQFYNNWAHLSNGMVSYDAIIRQGWQPERFVVGVLTNPDNGSGWIPLEELKLLLVTLVQKYPKFGGIMGWEYFNSLPGGYERPWEWAEAMTKRLRKA